MKAFRKFLAIFALAAPQAYAQVQLDISGAFDYDAVGTGAEITWSNTHTGVSHRIMDWVGDHSMAISTGRTFVNQASLTSGTGLPDSGIVGDYAIAQVFQNGNPTDGFTPADNVLRITASATGATLVTTSKTITLDLSQQAAYDSFNLLFVANRSNTSGSFRTQITANYADASSSVVYDSGLYVSTGASSPGGTLGNAAVPTLAGSDGGGMNTATDSSGLVSQVYSMNTTLRTSGSGATAQTVRDAALSSYLWEMADPISLDSSKVLQSLTFSVSAATNSRSNDLVIFGVNAFPIPEPSTYALLALGLSSLCFLRRRKG